ncbi:hypothetical protein SPBR_05444 [Sporothrix brasiliensis 5110]|uniref:Uncharacterized protein n=1 Tax=Sporothrix brasiliensis 5110 TaxID=1398154 RepID=A0A0C2IED0_9PEZI|nr:uncharacterized protein SPBR_05444 [Sporothrix brasiliensis 5110]KIH87621.1 hypothetical protein SPBR_05444 [Sporothrix brasiliensis 5110]
MALVIATDVLTGVQRNSIGRSGNTTVAAQQLSRPIEGMTGGTGNNRRRTEETNAGGLEILGKPGTDISTIGGGR